MGHKIQVTVDDNLNSLIRNKAAQMGLSVSSFARLALSNALMPKNKLIDKAMQQARNGDTETISLSEFNRQLDDL